MSYHIAVDIGASSGRLILGTYSDDKRLTFTEIHRFKNGFTLLDEKQRWNLTELCNEVLEGLKLAKKMGVEQCTVGIDTWAVDYALLNQKGDLIAEPVAYRDERTDGAIEEFSQIIPLELIYQKTGIQFLNFNTLYQLFRENKQQLMETSKILFIPDYIGYFLTGISVGEVSNVSSSQFLNLGSKDYDADLLEAIGLSKSKFPKLVESGTTLGKLRHELMMTGEFPDCEVIAVATHDTASAVVGIPVQSKTNNWAYLSSGTWSLIGVELNEPINGADALKANYTNEWGAYNTYRFLKNITGMWSVQEIARMLDYQYTYAEMAEAASKVQPFEQFIDLNDSSFTNPQNMIEAIQTYCKKTEQKVPQTVGELVMAVYSNLALLYAFELNRIEKLTNKSIDTLHIVGGGSNVKLLNQLTADLIGISVIAGPGEGTAIGNVLVQMINQKYFETLAEARNYLSEQIEVVTFEPKNSYDATLLNQFVEKVNL